MRKSSFRISGSPPSTTIGSGCQGEVCADDSLYIVCILKFLFLGIREVSGGVVGLGVDGIVSIGTSTVALGTGLFAVIKK